MESRWQASLGALSGSSRGRVHRVGEGGESDEVWEGCLIDEV